jgi:hypothetical protein
MASVTCLPNCLPAACRRIQPGLQLAAPLVGMLQRIQLESHRLLYRRQLFRGAAVFAGKVVDEADAGFQGM